MSLITLPSAVSHAGDNRRAQPGILLLLTGKFREFCAALRSRRELEDMDDRTLRDVGVHRSDITILTAMGRMGG